MIRNPCGSTRKAIPAASQGFRTPETYPSNSHLQIRLFVDKLEYRCYHNLATIIDTAPGRDSRRGLVSYCLSTGYIILQLGVYVNANCSITVSKVGGVYLCSLLQI
uniref:Uncharacterized protein n=1 Tax=Phage sp. ctcqm2 TaxID=2828007 RepID=A0A8S5STL6_9VIRU|nr:MAG TPA: hypothetical protein [Phage sp. ctcqm2]